MTIYESFKNKNIDELADWIAKNCNFDSAPWWKYWDENYCSKCEATVTCVSEFDENEHEFAYCEINHHCRYFKETEEMPDEKQTIKMWLESEID